jgi:hypothetical protein
MPPRSRRLLTSAAAAALAAVAVTSAAVPNAVAAADPRDSTPPPFTSVAAAYFTAWDGNRDGGLSVKEVDTLVNDPNITGVAAAAVAAIKLALRSKKVVAPVTGNQVFSAGRQASLARYYKMALGRLKRTKPVLFQPDDPRFDRLKQGQEGDCYMLSILAGMVARDPGAVRRMFEEQPDGACQVTFPGGRSVRVPPLTDTQLALYGSGAGGSRWFHVAEEAYALLRNADRSEERKEDVPSDSIVHGGRLDRAITYLTGRRAGSQSLRNKEDINRKVARLRKTFATVLGEKRLFTAAVGRGTVRPPGITANHAYAVLAYDPASDRVRVWNPHAKDFSPRGPAGLANGYLTRGGVFDVPTADFPRVFNYVAWETPFPEGAKKAAATKTPTPPDAPPEP